MKAIGFWNNFFVFLLTSALLLTCNFPVQRQVLDLSEAQS